MDKSLVNRLESGSVQQQRSAAYEMGKSNDPSYIPHLMRAYNDPDSGVRQNVENGLRRIGTEEAIEFLNADAAGKQDLIEKHGGIPIDVALLHIKELQTGSAESRRKAAQELGQLTESSESVILALMAARGTDPNSSVREAAAEALCAPVHQAMLQERPDLELDLEAGPVTVFLPLASIRWPQYCVGCLAPRPSEKIQLGVYNATKASKGARIGGLVGGLIGAAVGGAIGGGMDSSKINAYSMPVCKTCQRRLSGSNIRGLRGDQDGIVSTDVTTPLLSRQLSKGCVVLTFRNVAYAAAFRKANEGNVFDSVEACRMDIQAIKVDPELLEQSLDVGSESFEQSLLDLLKSHVPLKDLFVEPDIPPKKLANARQSCGLDDTARILALADCTALGSAKQCLLFGSEAIHYHNAWSSKSPGSGTIPYTELASRPLMISGFEISLGQEQYLDMSGCSVPKDKMLGILTSIQRQLAQPAPSADKDEKTVNVDPGSFEQSLLDLLKSRVSLNGLFVEPDIPSKKLANARQSCGLADTARILALADCTVFGSAKNCLIFGFGAIHYHNDWSAKSPGAGTIPYTEFASRLLVVSGHEISLGQNQYLNMSGCSVPKDKMLEILTSIQRLLA